MTTTSPLPPLVAYYGSLIDETRPGDDPWVFDSAVAEQVIPTLVRTVPVTAVQPGDFMGDYVVMIPIPWVLPGSFGDDEFTFECE